GRDRIFGSGKLRRCRLLSLLGEAEAGASIHVATSRFAYELLPCAPCRLTTPAVIRSSPSNSDGTRSGSFIVVVDRTTSRMAGAVCTRRAAYGWSFSQSLEPLCLFRVCLSV